jgi:type II secretory ATPase GspE/PulE/Tfp pilus assembly ATPase PilB-like protein
MSTTSEELSRENLGEVLVRIGLIDAEQMQEIAQTVGQGEKKLEEVLVEDGLISPHDLMRALSIQLKVPLIDLKRHTISPQILKLVPEELARKYNVLPLDVIGKSLALVMADATDIGTISDIAAVTKMRIEPMMGFPDEIREAIDRNYGGGSGGEEVTVVETPPDEEEEAKLEQLLAEEAQVPAIRTLNRLILQAIRSRASDIHIMPQKDKLYIRYRVDGVLIDKTTLNMQMHDALLSRLKIMSNMNIAERRRPQDGQYTVSVDGKNIDIRVACASTVYGEMAVLRIMRKSASLLELTDLGFFPDTLKRYQELLTLPFGMILLGGPTGSGKTTTLYASLNQLNSKERNIMTIEDPVEYHLPGINQFQVNPRADVSFANSLRAFMRLDPDIILVGEIRDTETAKIATQAALTGHLVFSSVHANDAVGILFRMQDLGVESYLICSSLAGTVAQRIVRRICSHCREAYEPSPEELAAYQEEMDEMPKKFYRGAGCNLCGGTGFMGQCGVYEILTLTEAVKHLFLSNATAVEIHKQAVKDGMETLKHDAMLKVKEGVTTIPEVLRNVYSSG